MINLVRWRQILDASIQRRLYLNEGNEVIESCPACGGKLTEEVLIYLVNAEDEPDELGSYIVSYDHGKYCNSCPVIVINEAHFHDWIFRDVMSRERRRDDILEYEILGIVDIDSIPEEKRDLPLGEDDNPIPLVPFIEYTESPEKQDDSLMHYTAESRSKIAKDRDKKETKPIEDVQKIGKNKRCPCGSGKKYKNCCGSDK